MAIFPVCVQPFRYLRKGDLGLAPVALHTSVAVGLRTHMAESGEEATVARQPHSGTPATIVRNGRDISVSAELSDMGERASRSEMKLRRGMSVWIDL
jgi:hypothetical protein